MADLVLTFEPPARLLSMNDSGHWSKTAPLIAEWRAAAALYACKVVPFGPSARRRDGRQQVTVLLPVPDARRRDPANYLATVKPIVDGLTDAGLWPDDTAEYVTVAEPALYHGTDVVVRVRPYPKADDD